MPERPGSETEQSAARHEMVPSPQSDVVILVPSRDLSGRILVEKVPGWVAQWVGKAPGEIEGKPVDEVFSGLVDAIPEVASCVLKDGTPVEEYCVEFTDAAGAERSVVISARRMDDYKPAPDSPVRTLAARSGPAVVMRVRDVTESVLARKRWAGVGAFHGIVGRSRPMLEVFYKIEVYGPTDAPVVISGETGTGKELVARALHERSPRRDKPFVAVNCCALSEDLFESELFGHEKGAFTGAVRSHKGRFERADKGTLFLDEVGDMPLRTQAKLLRVLEQGTIERVGGEREQPVDVRILAATNISLEQAVAVRRFRADLYHRLSVFRIHVPPLRERLDDLPLLVEHFLEMLGRRYGRPGARLTPDAMRLLREYHWPGNVRELRNVLERVFVETPGKVIGRNAFNEWIRERDYLSAGGWNLERLENERAMSRPIVVPPAPGRLPPAGGEEGPPVDSLPRLGRDRSSRGSRSQRYPLAVPAESSPFSPEAPIDVVYTVPQPLSRKPKTITEEMIRKAFAQAGGNATLAAKLLGVHKATLYRRMKSLGINRSDLENHLAESKQGPGGGQPEQRDRDSSGESEKEE